MVPALSHRFRVVLVDEHPIVRVGLASLIRKQSAYELCGEADDTASAYELIRESKPDVIVMDLALRGAPGLEVLRNLQLMAPAAAVLIVSLLDEEMYAARALRAGARGFVMKNAPAQQIVEALQRIVSGGVYLSEAMSSRLLNRFASGRVTQGAAPEEALSDRELEVYQFIGQGLSTREIAEQMHLSIKTIETYRAKIKEKLGLDNASRLVQTAVRFCQEASLSGNPR